ncbi:MAG TPA: PAS domain-containing protein, partial [Chitinophagaceae bacterium]|nr:PAS domain-containing protein [Chitinophagaceae bacterium]
MNKAGTDRLFPKLFDGEGEMSRLIRDYNWVATSLGAIEEWSPELQTTVSILLHSSFPMFLYWGDDLICFYNDAFRPSLGRQGKHPDILGMKGKEAWAEIWDEIHPLIVQVMETARVSAFEDRLLPIFRNGKLENVYWTFGYTPVFEADGMVRGVLIICTETTSNVNKFNYIVEQTKSPILIVKGEELIVTELNQATLELWKQNKSILGKPLLTVVPELGPQGFADLLLDVLRTGRVHHGWEEPAFFDRENGQREVFYFNFEFSPFREANGDITGVMVLSTDVTQQVITRNKLKEAEYELGLAMDAADLGTWHYNPNNHSFRFNSRTRELLKWPAVDEIPIKEAMLSIHPEDRVRVVREYHRALNNENEGRIQFEFRTNHAGTEKLTFIKAIGRAYYNAAQAPYHFSGTLQDITDSKLAEEALAYRNALLEAQNNAIPDGMLIVDTKGKIITFNRRFSEIWKMPRNILDARDDDAALKHAMAQMVDPENFIRRVKYLYENNSDAAREEIFLKDGRILERYGHSVIDEAGKKYGWAWYFRDVTKEKRAEEELIIRKERYRSTFENAAVGIAHVATDGRWLNVNDRLCSIFGYSRQEMLDLTFQELTHHDDLSSDYTMITDLLEGKMNSFSMEKRFMHKK